MLNADLEGIFYDAIGAISPQEVVKPPLNSSYSYSYPVKSPPYTRYSPASIFAWGGAYWTEEVHLMIEQQGPNAGKLNLAVCNNAATNGCVSDWRGLLSTTNSWEANKWYHVFGIINGYNCQLWINGVKESEGNCGYVDLDISNHATIGRYSTATRATSPYNFVGIIDEIKWMKLGFNENKIPFDYEHRLFIEQEPTIILSSEENQL